MTEQEGPWHRVLVDDEHRERMGDLDQDTVGPMATIRMLLERVGEREDGTHRLPALNQLYESLLDLPTSVNAKRAKLTADALGHDPWKPHPDSREWDPDQPQQSTDRDGNQRRGGLPRRDEKD